MVKGSLWLLGCISSAPLLFGALPDSRRKSQGESSCLRTSRSGFVHLGLTKAWPVTGKGGYAMRVLETPDGRYIIVHGRLWRRQRPDLEAAMRDRLVRELMDGRRAVKVAKRSGDAGALAQARSVVDAAKHGLGERGPLWWTDGVPDQNRRMVRNTAYADWYAGLPEAEKAEPSRR